MFSAKLLGIPLHRQCHYVPDLHDMPCGSPVVSRKSRSSYGTHLLDHLTANGAGLTGGQVAVIAVLQVDADLPRRSFTY